MIGLLALLVAVSSTSIACAASGESNDETFDFRRTTTSEVRGSTPYDTYVLLTERAGIKFLNLEDADSRAEMLCIDPIGTAGPPDERSPQDAALIIAYCPETGP